MPRMCSGLTKGEGTGGAGFLATLGGGAETALGLAPQPETASRARVDEARE